MTRILLRGGCVLTLGARSQNLSRGDVLVEDDRIAEVGTDLRARDADQVDATDTIVMPGFVDTHRHAWTSLFRNLGDGDPRSTVRAPMWAVADHYGPEDAYAATLIGLLGAAEAGITTVVDWSHLPIEGGLAEAALRAHAEAGLRTVYVHAPTGARSAASDLGSAVAALAAAAGPLTTIAFGSVVPGAGDADDDDSRASEAAWAVARSLGLRIHAHAPGRTDTGVLARAAKRGLLGDDTTLVHHAAVNEADLEAVASSGAAISLTPASDMAAGVGSPPIQELIDRDVRPGLGIDDERVSPGDLFAQMRATISLQHATVFDRKLAGKAGLPKLMSTRDVIRFATRDGARVAGLGGATGSIEAGMPADLIVLRTDRPNIFPINDPIGAVVWGMDTSNVDRVLVAGRTLVRDGRLEADVDRARALGEQARRRVAETAGMLERSGT